MMMSFSMMRDRYEETHKVETNGYECICGYEFHKESDYINNQGQLVSIMVCDSCGHIEHWVENAAGLIEQK